MKKIVIVLLAVLAVCTVAAPDAQAQYLTKKRKSSKESVLYYRNMPLEYDAPCNLQEETFANFIDDFIDYPKVRQARTADVQCGVYSADEDSLVIYENSTCGKEWYQKIFGQFTQSKWNRFFSARRVERKLKDGTTQTDTYEWKYCAENVVVYRWITEADDGGSGVDLTFERRDGKWYLTAILVAG